MMFNERYNFDVRIAYLIEYFQTLHLPLSLYYIYLYLDITTLQLVERDYRSWWCAMRYKEKEESEDDCPPK